MCGISGIIGGNFIRQKAVEAMTDLIVHRGPDDYGYFYGQGIALGHRRLAIVDLSDAGHQPMEYMNRYMITFNGEIYNYIEIRKDLEVEGYSFKSNTDTEVILASYDRWGTKCVEKFNGMWAFAIYDKEKRTVFCSRDRFGVKPFYYWVTPDSAICFGSEIKQFTVLPGWKALANPQRVYDYLVWGLSNHTDETLFKNVYELKKGCFSLIEINNLPITKSGRLATTQWYDLTPKKFVGSFEDAGVEFKNLFIDSIKLRLRADVPVGSCLSGGLDSSSIVCVLNDMLSEKGLTSFQKTFSSCSKINKFDEKQWIDQVVRSRNIDGYYVYPSLNGLFEELPRMTWHHDEPFNTSDLYAQWSVCRLAADNNVKVVLDGQGGDELLAGYHSFFAAYFTGLLKSRKLFKLWREVFLAKNIHNLPQVYSFAKVVKLLLPGFIKKPFIEIFGSHSSSPDWLNIKALNAMAKNPFLAFESSVDSIQGMSRMQLLSTHLPTLLQWEDRDSMAHSVESRCPFLDYRLVEFVFGLPDEFKLSEGITKRVLRFGMNKVLPNSIRDRIDKRGFMTPEEVWLKSTGPELFRERLNDSIEVSDGILNQDSAHILSDIVGGRAPFSFLPWRLINFGEWMKVFNVSVR